MSLFVKRDRIGATPRSGSNPTSRSCGTLRPPMNGACIGNAPAANGGSMNPTLDPKLWLQWLTRSILTLTVASSADAPYNKSLDASGTSGLVIDNVSVTWLSPAASTQMFG